MASSSLGLQASLNAYRWLTGSTVDDRDLSGRLGQGNMSSDNCTNHRHSSEQELVLLMHTTHGLTQLGFTDLRLG